MKQKGSVGKKAKKRVHFAEIEQEIIPDQEPVHKESTPQHDEETDWLKDVKTVEEQIAVQGEEDGVEYEPFNLDEERERGNFEEDGFYVEHRHEKKDNSDAWLLSEDSKICSKAVIENHEKMQNALAAADVAPKMSNNEILDIKQKIVNLLLPRETVLAALKRIAKNKHSTGTSKEETRSKMTEFEELTEAADALLNSGDTDAYSMHREEFEHELKASKTDDMFAENSEDEGTSNAAICTDDPSRDHEESHTRKGVKRMRYESQNTDFSSWPVGELKRFLMERDIDCTGIIEKEELISKAKELDKKKHGYESFQAPEGYTYDPSSGYFYSAEYEMYYDGPTRCFYNPKTSKWYDENWKEII